MIKLTTSEGKSINLQSNRWYFETNYSNTSFILFSKEEGNRIFCQEKGASFFNFNDSYRLIYWYEEILNLKKL